MLGKVLILLACVSDIVSAYTPSQAPTNNGYQQPRDNRRDINQELRQLNDRVNAASRGEVSLVDRLVQAIEEDQRNTDVTDTFEREQFLELRKRQDRQSLAIEQLEREAEELILLTDDIAVLNSTVAELQRQANVLARESTVVQQEANDVANTDRDQARRLAAVRADLAGQARKLEELENVTEASRDRLNENLNLVENITTAVDSEKAENIVLTLTSDEPTRGEAINEDFRGVTPIVQYGFSSIHISGESQSYVLPDNYATKGYGSGYGASSLNSSIDFEIDVVYDSESNRLVFTLLDSSTNGFYIDEVVVEATVVNIDNKVFPTPYY